MKYIDTWYEISLFILVWLLLSHIAFIKLNSILFNHYYKKDQIFRIKTLSKYLFSYLSIFVDESKSLNNNKKLNVYRYFNPNEENEVLRKVEYTTLLFDLRSLFIKKRYVLINIIYEVNNKTYSRIVCFDKEVPIIDIIMDYAQLIEVNSHNGPFMAKSCIDINLKSFVSFQKLLGLYAYNKRNKVYSMEVDKQGEKFILDFLSNRYKDDFNLLLYKK